MNRPGVSLGYRGGLKIIAEGQGGQSNVYVLQMRFCKIKFYYTCFNYNGAIIVIKMSLVKYVSNAKKNCGIKLCKSS